MHDDVIDEAELEPQHVDRVSTGVPQLDEILMGGLPSGGVYLLRGGPGIGKTTLGLQFLRAGVERGERCLFLSLAQPVSMLERIAASHGWTLDGMDVRAITAHEAVRLRAEQQDVFVPDEVELVDVSERVRTIVTEVRPHRLVFDSLNFVKMFVTAPGRYEQEMAILVELCGRLGVTAVCILNTSQQASRSEMILDGTIDLERLESAYGGELFRMHVRKMRASAFHGGHHDYQIVTGGLRVFPRLIDITRGRARAEPVTDRPFGSGIDELDDLLGGELSPGASVLVMGPSGVGKSSVALRYAHTALREGRKVLYFLLEERTGSFLDRAARLRMDVRPYVDDDRARVIPIQATRILPGELAVVLREGLDWGAELIVIDSLSGYYQLVPDAGLLRTQIRDIMRYTGSLGVLSIVTLASENVFGAVRPDTLDVSEAADVTIHLKFYEADGALRKGISVVKRRDGDHDASVRDLVVDRRGVRVGSESVHLRGLLSERPALADGGEGSGGVADDRASASPQGG